MAKKGMKRPERTHVKPRNEVTPVPEIQGKAKSGKVKASDMKNDVYPVIDTDLGRDNVENDIPYADRQDLR